MELVDMLGLGSSSLRSRGSSPLFGSINNNADLQSNLQKKKKKQNKTK